MLEGAKQEGTSDVAYSRNQPSHWKMTRTAAAEHSAIIRRPANSREEVGGDRSGSPSFTNGPAGERTDGRDDCTEPAAGGEALDGRRGGHGAGKPLPSRVRRL